MRPDGPAFVIRREGVRGVFNDSEAVLLRYLQQGIHFARMAVQMNGEDGFWAITAIQLCARIIDRFFYFSWIDVESVRFHVDEDGASAHLFNHIDARTKCHWSCQDRVAGTDSQADQSKMQGCRAGSKRGLAQWPRGNRSAFHLLPSSNFLWRRKKNTS